MLLTGVSNLAQLLNSQDSMRKTSLDLQSAQTELSTGRYSDVNLTLGGNVSRNLDWRLGLSEVTQFIDTNTQAGNKADATQAALESIKSSANIFLSTLAGARDATNGQTLAQNSADGQIQSFQQAVNVSYAGQYLMAGVNSSTPPINTYDNGAAETAFDTAFQSYFGFPKTDPQAQNITADQMNNFLDGPFEALFSDASWSANFSAAGDTNVKTRIDQSQTIDTSANANEQAFRDMMKAMVAVKDAGTGQLNQTTFQAVVDYALKKTSNAINGIGEIESRVGMAQQAITVATAKHTSMQTILQGQISDTESVDSSQAALNVNNLMSQLQANYAVTGKLSQLSLLQYLPVGS